MPTYETILDLARQRARDIGRSPNFTRDARHMALDLERSLEAELDAFNEGRPIRGLFCLGQQEAA